MTVGPAAVYASAEPQTFSASLDFLDPDGDVSALSVKIRDGAGTTLDLGTIPIDGITGLVSGSLQGTFTANAIAPDSYTVLLQLIDSSSLVSNVLSAAVRIAEFPWASRTADPIAREYTASAELDGKLYVAGGQLTNAGTIPGPATSTVEYYDPATDAWTTVAPMPTARMGLTLTAYNGKLYAIGGRTDGFSTSSVTTIEVYDPTTGWFTPVQPPNFEARYHAAAAVVNTVGYGDLIVVAGGEKEAMVLDSVQGYNPVTNAWINLQPLGTARGQLALSTVNGKLYAVGGYAGVAAQWVGTVEEYSPATGLWTIKEPMPTARAQFAVATLNGQLLVAGGENAIARSLTTLESYDPVSNTWDSKTDSKTAFASTCVGVMNGLLYVAGNGLTMRYNQTNDIY